MDTTKTQKKQQGMKEEAALGDKTTAILNGDILIVRGIKGESKKKLKDPRVELVIKDDKIILQSKKSSKRIKKIMGSFKAHIKNMVKGSNEGHKYILKICSGHFPMNVSVTKKEITIKNFFGEKVPRVLKLKEDVDVKLDGDNLIVESTNKELAGQTAADIETLTTITNRDLRIFQDGIYIIGKDGKEIK